MGGALIGRLEAAAAAGFDGIEFFWDDIAASGLSASELAGILGNLGLEAVALQPVRGFEGDPPEAMAAGYAGARAFFETACELGAPIVGICANEKDSAGGIAETAEMLGRLAGMAGEYGLRLGFEGLAWSHRLNHIADVWQAVARVDAANLGIVIDSFHLGMVGDTARALPAMDPARIVVLQLSDAVAMAGLGVKDISRHHRRFPGEGELGVRSLVEAVRGTGYDGVVTLELFNDAYRAMPALAVARMGMASLEAMLGPSA